MSTDVHTEVVQRVCRSIEDNSDGMPTLAAMGEHVGMSPFHLQHEIAVQRHADAERQPEA